MIQSLTIDGFKRFKSRSFRLEPLTLLTGLNGSGKTSLIQALLLAREATHLPPGHALRLNELFGMELGTVEDVRNWHARDDISVTMTWLTDTSATSAVWTLSAPSLDDLFLEVIAGPESNQVPKAFARAPRLFTYLSAERLGPRSVLGASPLPDHALEVGVRGEYCAQILAASGNRKFDTPGRLHPDESGSPLLKYQVERWLSEIARPIQLDATRIPNTAVTALRFRSPGGEWVRAPNMGFGVSYALPIILAGLLAPRGGLLVVENPEAHLHPAGQSRIGVFLAWLAGAGVQVLVETHSDHVLNGVRRAIAEFRYLGADQAIAHFFEVSETDEAEVKGLRFTDRGGMSNWPSGFFDQYQIDTATLGRLRRRAK